MAVPLADAIVQRRGIYVCVNLFFLYIFVMYGSDVFCFGLVCCSRKMRQKRVVRVPAISLKMADIPPDDYSWRKYGQKPIKGSPHPRYIICIITNLNFSYFFSSKDCFVLDWTIGK